MTIYGIEIVHPHSGELSRSEALTLLKNELKHDGGGMGRAQWERLSTKEQAEHARKFGRHTLECEDVNGCISASLNW